MKSNIIFRMVAYTDAAGKFTIDAPRNGNEDNFFFAYDLSKDALSKGEPDVDTQMSECGLLMVVADGMGGMNAGEVASQIAVDTVAEFFTPGKITPQLAEKHEMRQKYLEQVVAEADARIKKDSKHNEEHQGMGSTIILAWIVGNEMTLCWCGDSRAYRYNPASGIELLSKDHSYVQELVDKGLIKYEDAFDHPQGNIITRSLGDVSKKAVPETKLYEVYDNDIILLCSDGLSGVLRDKRVFYDDGEPIEGDTLEDIIRSNRGSLKQCREALWRAAEKADWYDNVTAVLCEIRSGAGDYAEVPKIMTIKKSKRTSVLRTVRLAISLVFLIGIVFVSGWKLSSAYHSNSENRKTNETVSAESGKESPVDSIQIYKNSLLDRIKNLKADLKDFPDVLEKMNILDASVNEASDSAKLKEVGKNIDLWEKKLPVLTKIVSEITDKTEKSRMLKKVYESRKIQEKEWYSEIEKIKKKTEKKEENKITPKVKDRKKDTLTPVPDTTISPTIQQNDSYNSFCKFIESKYKSKIVAIMCDTIPVDSTNFDRFKNKKVTVRLKKSN